MNNVQVMVNYWQQENSLASPNFINFMRIQRHLQISQIATVSYSQSPGEGGMFTSNLADLCPCGRDG